MRRLFANRTWRCLFAAQVVGLFGAGIMTVGLALLAYDLAGERAGAVLGTALAIKMIAYVTVAPVAGALAGVLPRRALLVGADAVRAATALALPFVDAVWQVYVLVFVLHAASAVFTPTFQATLPDVLPDRGDYTRALSMSRIAQDTEQVGSPAAAGLLLLVMSFHTLFAVTVAGFVLSGLLVLATRLPAAGTPETAGIGARLAEGMSIYLATPRLRGLLALSLAVAAAGAFVIVNTVVVVRAGGGGGEAAVALALVASGAGSVAMALSLPRLIERWGDRAVMLAAGHGLAPVLTGLALVLWLSGGWPGWGWVLGLWAVLGALSAALVTPSGRLLARSAEGARRPAVFAAQFALSHAMWLVAYPLAGHGGEALGLPTVLILLAALAAVGALAARRLWPAGSEAAVAHDHPDLPAGHPHMVEHRDTDDRHRHPPIVDRLHGDRARRG